LVVNPHEGMKPDEDMSMCCSICDLLQRAMIGEARAHFACPATWAASPVLYCPKAGHKSTSHAKGSLYPCQRSVTGAPCVVSCMAATPSQHSESTAMEHTCMHAMHFAPCLQASLPLCFTGKPQEGEQCQKVPAALPQAPLTSATVQRQPSASTGKGRPCSIPARSLSLAFHSYLPATPLQGRSVCMYELDAIFMSWVRLI